MFYPRLLNIEYSLVGASMRAENKDRHRGTTNAVAPFSSVEEIRFSKFVQVMVPTDNLYY